MLGGWLRGAAGQHDAQGAEQGDDFAVVSGGGSEPMTAAAASVVVHRLTSTTAVPKDRREACDSLLAQPSLASVVSPEDYRAVFDLLGSPHVVSDDELLEKVTQVLVAVLDDGNKAAQMNRDACCAAVNEPGLLLALLKPETAFWVKYNCVQLMTKIHEYDPMVFQSKVLADPMGVAALVDVLNDTSNDGMLRNEALVLIDALTSINPDIQTIMAFENVFDTLFGIVSAEGGISGDAIVQDCLRVVHNIVRGNTKTQKLFREMRSAVHIVALLEGLLKLQEENPVTSNANAAACGALTIFRALLAGDNSTMFAHSEDGAAMRHILCQVGALRVVGQLAVLRTVDATTNIESMRVLQRLLDQNSAAVEGLINLTFTMQTGPSSTQQVAVLWGMLRVALCDMDKPKRESAYPVLLNALELGQEGTALVMTKNVSAAASSLYQCGNLLATSVLTPTPITDSTVFAANVLLSQCLRFVHVAETVARVPWRDGSTTFLAEVSRTTMEAVKTCAAVTQPTHQKGFTPGQDVATVVSMFRPLLMWARVSPGAAALFLADTVFPLFLVEFGGSTTMGAAEESTIVSLRLVVVALLSQICLGANHATQLQQQQSQCSAAECLQLARVQPRALIEGLAKKVGVHTLSSLLSAAESLEAWRDAPSNALAVADRHSFDGQLKLLVKEAITNVQPLLVSFVTGGNSALANETAGEGGARVASVAAAEDHHADIEPFRQIIRQQDEKIAALERRLVAANEANLELEVARKDAAADYNQRLEEAKAAQEALRNDLVHREDEIVAMREELSRTNDDTKQLVQSMAALETMVEQKTRELEAMEADGAAASVEEVAGLKKAVEQLTRDRRDLLLLVGELAEIKEVLAAEGAAEV